MKSIFPVILFCLLTQSVFAQAPTLTALFGTRTPCDGQYWSYPERGHLIVQSRSVMTRGYAASQAFGIGDMGWYTFVELEGRAVGGNSGIILLEYGQMTPGTSPDRILTATEGIILEAGDHLQLYVQCYGEGTVYPYAWFQLVPVQ